MRDRRRIVILAVGGGGHNFVELRVGLGDLPVGVGELECEPNCHAYCLRCAPNFLRNLHLQFGVVVELVLDTDCIDTDPNRNDYPPSRTFPDLVVVAYADRKGWRWR